eukprot:14981546-Heterocapsa_arctica.AAC.1
MPGPSARFGEGSAALEMKCGRLLVLQQKLETMPCASLSLSSWPRAASRAAMSVRSSVVADNSQAAPMCPVVTRA